MILWSALPFLTFCGLFVRESLAPKPERAYSATDIGLNLAGLLAQGVLVPLIGYGLATEVLPRLIPQAQGLLPFGFWGALALNLIVVDFLYYWQHRALHQIKPIWPLHLTHHASPRVDIWATARNCLWINGLFVYLLVNPWLGFLCDRPDGFFIGAMMTASLDIWHHTRTLPAPRFVKGWLTTPANHHRHHDITRPPANYGANFIIWDRMFGTADLSEQTPLAYAAPNAPSFWRQFLLPWKMN